MKAEYLELSKLKKAELYNFMKETRDKEEYRRASAIKQKLEGLPYRTIAKNLDVNYRNVYNWIKEYKEYGLDGIRSKIQFIAVRGGEYCFMPGLRALKWLAQLDDKSRGP
ncbi:MAG TPA: helix-turn-helix domain-containing protein [Candidatus Bathyarchaeia archaeon]|nr:helix-turn-helix domain-containing protein [Candidatus Bathyarchaeia archaeon]